MLTSIKKFRKSLNSFTDKGINLSGAKLKKYPLPRLPSTEDHSVSAPSFEGINVVFSGGKGLEEFVVDEYKSKLMTANGNNRVK